MIHDNGLFVFNNNLNSALVKLKRSYERDVKPSFKRHSFALSKNERRKEKDRVATRRRKKLEGRKAARAAGRGRSPHP
jgi:ribosomal protein S21